MLWRKKRESGESQPPQETLTEAIALAEKNRTVALAGALLTKVTALADKAKEYAVNMETAAGQRTIDKARAAQTAVNARAAAENTPWWDYQKKLVDNAVDYITGLVPKVIQKFTADAQAERDEIVADATKAKDLAVAAAELRRVQKVADAGSFKTFVLAAADHRKDYSDGEAALEFAQVESRATAEKTYAYAAAAATEKQAKDTATSSHTAVYDAAAVIAHITNPSSRIYFAALNGKDATVRQAGIDNTFTRDIIDAKEARNLSRTTASQTYEVGVHALSQTQDDADTDSFKTYQTEAADHAKTYATGFATAYTTALKGVSTSADATAHEEDQSEETLEDGEAQLEETKEESDAEAQKSLLSAVAGAFQSAIGAWSAAVNTPWSRFQKANADAEKARADAEGTLGTDYASQAGGVVLGYLNGLASIGKTLADAIADGLDGENQSLADAVKDYSTDTATAQHDFATTMAGKVAQHDKDVTGLTKTYRDSQSTRQKTRDDAVDAAQWTYERAAADRLKTFTITTAGITFSETTGAITAEQASTQRAAEADSKTIDTASYEQTRKTSVAAAESARVNGNAADYKTWVNDVGQKHVDLATDAKTAIDDLAGDLKSAEDGLTSEEANAAKALAAALANAEAAAQTGSAQAGANLGNAMSPVDGDNSIGETGIDNGLREALVHNRSTYENEIRTEHKNKMLAASAPAGAMQNLLTFQRSAAQQEVTWSTAKGTAVDAYEQATSSAYLQQAQGLETANENRTAGKGNADVAATGTQANADAQLSIDATGHMADFAVASSSAATKAIQEGVKGETKYDLERVKAQKDYYDALATANVVWTGKYVEIQVAMYLGTTIPYVAHPYLDPDHREEEKADAEAVIEAEYQAAKKAASAVFAGKVGDAQIARAGELGDMMVSEANEENDAEIAFNNSAAGDNGAYEGAVTAGEVVHIADTSSAESAFDIQLAVLQKALTAALGLANIDFTQAMGAANCTKTTGIATAQTGFWSGERAATASRYTAWLPLQTTTYAAFLAAQATAQSQWTTGIGPAYVIYATAMVQADAGQETALAQAIANQNNALEDANVVYVTATEPSYAAAEVARVAAARAWIESESGADDTHSIHEAAAQRVYDEEIANAARTQGIAYATSEKAYQVSIITADSGDYATLRHTHDLANADADLVRETSAGNSDVIWTTDVAEGDKTWQETLANADHAYFVEKARINRDLILSIAPHDEALFIAQADAQTAYWTAETSTATVHRTAEYCAIANYQESNNIEKSDAIVALATALPLPWIDDEAAVTTIKRDWFTNSGHSQFLAMGGVLNAADGTYNSTVDALYTAWAADTALATKTFVIAVANATYAVISGDSDAERVNSQHMAEADEIWQVATAIARREVRIGDSTAQRDFVDNANATTRDATLASIVSTDKTATQGAVHAYTIADASAAGIWRHDKASSKRTYEIAIANATNTHVATTAHADQLLDSGEAIAAAARSSVIFTATAAYRLAESSGISSDVHAYTTSHASPWSTYDDGLLAAVHGRNAAVIPAERDRDIAIANSIRDLAVSRTLAWEALEVTKNVALGNLKIANAGYELQQTIDEIAADTAKAEVINLPSWEEVHEPGTSSWDTESGGNSGNSTNSPRKPADAAGPSVEGRNASDMDPNRGSTTTTANQSDLSTLEFNQKTDGAKRAKPEDGNQSSIGQQKGAVGTLGARPVGFPIVPVGTRPTLSNRQPEAIVVVVPIANIDVEQILTGKDLKSIARLTIISGQGPMSPQQEAEYAKRLEELRLAEELAKRTAFGDKAGQVTDDQTARYNQLLEMAILRFLDKYGSISLTIKVPPIPLPTPVPLPVSDDNIFIEEPGIARQAALGLWVGTLNSGRMLSWPARWFGADFSKQDAYYESLWAAGRLTPEDEKFTRWGSDLGAKTYAGATYAVLLLIPAEAGGTWLAGTSTGQTVLSWQATQTGLLTLQYAQYPVAGTMLYVAGENGRASYYAYQVGDIDASSTLASQAILDTAFAYGATRPAPRTIDQRIASRYSAIYAQAWEDTVARFNAGEIRIPIGENGVPLHWKTVLGNETDRLATSRLLIFLQQAGIQEGPGTAVLVNRKLPNPNGSGDYVRPDVMLKRSRLILDGTIGAKHLDSAQPLKFYEYSGGYRIIIVRPGSVPKSWWHSTPIRVP